MRTTQLLYENIADDIASMIDDGMLVAGERVPSVRELSRQRRLSISTVLQAYRVLEDRGLIEARPQSGHYVRPGRQRIEEPPVTHPPRLPLKVDVHALVARILADGHLTHLQFGAAIPTPDALPVRKLRRIVASVARRGPEWVSNYSFPPGEEALRRQIALYMRDWGVDARADDIIVTNGCMEALNLCLRAVAKPGDVIALESPTYFGLLQIIESLGMKALEIASHPRDGISVEALGNALERARIKACVLMPTVSNPSGATMPDGAKRRIVRMLSTRGVPLIEDAIFCGLHFDARQPYAAKAYDKQGDVMLCSSFSKTFSPGFRIGWVAPGRHHESVLALKYINSIGVPLLLQCAAAEFLANGGHHQFLRRVRRFYSGQVRRYAEAVTRHFPAGTRVSRPSGGYVLWIVMPEAVDAVELYEQALRHGVGFCPGALFSATGRYGNCLRINCGAAWSAEVAAGIGRLGELAASLAVRASSNQPFRRRMLGVRKNRLKQPRAPASMGAP
jgi:DNA-binding transcriptional MocR family regulator